MVSSSVGKQSKTRAARRRDRSPADRAHEAYHQMRDVERHNAAAVARAEQIAKWKADREKRAAEELARLKVDVVEDGPRLRMRGGHGGAAVKYALLVAALGGGLDFSGGRGRR